MTNHATLKALIVAATTLAAPVTAMAQNVGTAAAVNPTSALARGGAERTITIGADVIFRDRVVTSDDGLVQVLFVDGSAFTVGPNASVTIDEFVYNPADQSGELVAEVAQGALRFVGGALSKRGRNNSVRFKTSGGTLGVRGAIVNIDTDPPCAAAPCPSLVASLVFGDELVLERAGQPDRRIYEPGYSLVVTGQGAGSTVNVVPTGSLDLSQLQQQLSGSPTGDGGAPVPPTGENVIQSQLPQINSQRAPVTVLPRPRPIIVRTQYAPDDDAPGISNAENELAVDVVEQSQSDAIDADIEEELDNLGLGPNVTRTGFVAVTATPNAVNAAGVGQRPLSRPALTTTTPGRVGITAPTGVPITASLVRNANGEIIGLNVNGSVLPFPEEEGETSVGRLFTSAAEFPVRGSILRGPNNFVFYHFEEDIPNAGEEGALYIVSGELTPVEQILPTTPIGEATIREYELSDDFQNRSRNISSALPQLNPLIAREFGNILNTAAETSFFIAERGGERSFAQTFYAGLLITGSGPDQRSAVMVDAGELVRLNGEAALVGNVRGGYRLNSTIAAVSSSGATGTLVPENGFGGFYGANANNFVYTTGPSSTAALVAPSEQFIFDNQAAGGFLNPDERLSQFTVVGSLKDQTPVGDFERRSAVFEGVAAGVIHSSVDGPIRYSSRNVGDMLIAFDPTNSAVGGFITVDDKADADTIISRYRFAFGLNLGGDPEESPAQSGFVDNDTFGAVEAKAADPSDDDPTIAVRDDGSITPASVAPKTYVVSADAVPQNQIFRDAGVTPCECKFMEWGWWGSEVTTTGESGSVTATAHLGTWAAGEITDAADLPTTGRATYRGHAVGNVVNGTSGTTREYVAAGGLRVDFDFGNRSGRIAITNFDNRNFSGDIAQIASGGVGNQFGGLLSGGGLTGNALGAFTTGPRGPAQGVLGNFDVSGDNYEAVGIFVGER